MKAPYLAHKFPWITYAPTVLFIVLAVLSTSAVYDTLPARIATTFDFENNPAGYMQKTTYTVVILGYMIAMASIFMVFDRFYMYVIFPVPLTSAISGAIQLFTLIMHLMILDIGIFPDLSVTWSIIMICTIPCAYVLIHMVALRRMDNDISDRNPLWTDNSPQSWLTTVFFFTRPILPHKVVAYRKGLVLRATTYSFGISWDQISSIEHVSSRKAMTGTGVRLNTSPSRSVKLKLKDKKLPLIFSIDNEKRLIREWKARQ